MDAQPPDVSHMAAARIEIRFIAVNGFADRDQLFFRAADMLVFDPRLPVARLFLGLREAEDVNAIRVESIVGRAECRFLPQARFDELGEPYAALRGLSVSQREPGRDRMPI